jgi:hypothetical protein
VVRGECLPALPVSQDVAQTASAPTCPKGQPTAAARSPSVNFARCMLCELVFDFKHPCGPRFIIGCDDPLYTLEYFLHRRVFVQPLPFRTRACAAGRHRVRRRARLPSPNSQVAALNGHEGPITDFGAQICCATRPAMSWQTRAPTRGRYKATRRQITGSISSSSMRRMTISSEAAIPRVLPPLAFGATNHLPRLNEARRTPNLRKSATHFPH